MRKRCVVVVQYAKQIVRCETAAGQDLARQCPQLIGRFDGEVEVALAEGYVNHVADHLGQRNRTNRSWNQVAIVTPGDSTQILLIEFSRFVAYEQTIDTPIPQAIKIVE
jgi:hypothetical protein